MDLEAPVSISIGKLQSSNTILTFNGFLGNLTASM